MTQQFAVHQDWRATIRRQKETSQHLGRDEGRERKRRGSEVFGASGGQQCQNFV